MPKLPFPIVGGGLLALSLAACTSVGMVSYPAEYISMKSPGEIWITQGDDPTFVELRGATLHGDTLAGFDKNGAYTELPIGAVKLMKARAVSPTKTAVVFGVAAVATAVTLTQVIGNNGPASICYTPGSSSGGVHPCGELGSP
jgi:hypothetical protein